MLELDRVTKSFGDVVACADVSLRVKYGEVFGLAGGGKTTVLRIAAGLLAPDGGTVHRTGRPGYLPQIRGLYARMRVLDHLVYLAELHGADVNDAVRAAELWAARFDLRALRGERVRQLSAVEQQRLCLAAAFVSSPDLLVLDEPFAGLDAASADVLAELVRERATAGTAVLLATDELGVVERLCDRAGVLHNGRMVAEGAVDELRARVELVVSAPAAPPDWAAGLPGVTTLSVHNGLFRLALTDGADDQAVLAAALATGPVREFSRVRPGLADVFRDVVGA